MIERLNALLERIGNHAPTTSTSARLIAAYQQPPRAYHSLQHIMACLQEFDSVQTLCESPVAVEAAIWFHDAIYDSRRADNEEQSAELAREMLAECGAAPSFCERVMHLIRMTRHDQLPATADEQLIVDIDLSILGKTAELFDEYERGIREEYRHVDEAAFRAGRAAILQKFLARDAIYSLPEFRKRYEAAARQNLQRSIDRLEPASGRPI